MAVRTAESVGNAGSAAGRDFGWPVCRSWCPLESSSCVNQRQSKTANSQAKSHTCNGGNVLPPVEVSVFIFRLCHGQFPLPCHCVMLCCSRPPLLPSVSPQPAGGETQQRVARTPDLCFIPWTSAGFRVLVVPRCSYWVFGVRAPKPSLLCTSFKSLPKTNFYKLAFLL